MLFPSIVPIPLPSNSHTHLPLPVHSDGCPHWSRRGWGGRAGAGAGAAGWWVRSPAPGQGPLHSHRPRTPGSTSIPYLSPFCRPRGSEGGGSCGTWERQREAPYSSCTISDAGPCPQRWAAVRGLGLSLRLGPPDWPACGLAQLTVVSQLAEGQIPVLPPLVLCWSFELLSLNVARPRRHIPKAGRVV